MKTRTLTRGAILLSLLIILGMLPPISLGLPIPIVMQNLGILLIARMLTPKSGTLVIGLFIGLVAMGFPILTGGRGGLPILFGPTGGYIVGWLLVPAIYGLMMRSSAHDRFSLPQLISLGIAGILIPDLAGLLWLTIGYHVPLNTAFITTLSFMPGDGLKLLAAATVLKSLPRTLRQPN